jgi:uncharacterized protein (UPF0248 family)
MKTNIESAVLIDKDEIALLHFPKEDVLFEKDEVITRYSKLNNALSIGNLEHEKVTILFQDNEGLKKVETTIWSVTDFQIILKKGVIIPIHRIVNIF